MALPYDPEGFPVVNVLHMGGGAITASVGGDPASKPAPDTSNVMGTVPVALQVDPAGNLQTRGQVTTDEGSTSYDFDGAAMEVALSGTSLFTAGSTAVVGSAATAYTTELRIGDYVVKASEPTFWAQVASIESDHALTLTAAYGGLGGPTAAALTSPFAISLAAPGAVTTVGSYAILADLGGVTFLRRDLGVGGRKGYLPLSGKWRANVDLRNGNQIYIGFWSPNGVCYAWFALTGAVATAFSCLSASDAGTTETTNGSYAAGGLSSTDHIYGVDVLFDRVEFYIDNVLVATHRTHIPGPYMELAERLQIMHGAANAVLSVDYARVRNYDDFHTDGAAAASGGTSSSEITGLPQSKPSPDTSNVEGTTPVTMNVDPAGNLQVRGQVTTDEGSFADDFPDNAAHTVYTALTGTSLFTAASTAVVGTATAYLSEVRIGDYVVLASEPTFWSQVAAVVDNTHLTLSAAYAGAGGPTAASYVSQHFISTSGGGAVALMPGISSVALSPAAAGISTAALDRAVGAGGRKGFVPIAVQWYGSIDQRLAIEKSVLGLVNDTLGDGAYFYLHGTTATTFECVSSCGFSAESTTVTYASAGTSATEHRYEVKALVDKAEFYVDGTLVATHYGHTPRPYVELTERISISTAPVPIPEIKLPVGDLPYGVACDALGQAWIANLGDNTVTVYNIATRKLIGTYATGVGPVGVAVDALGQVWVTNSGANTVTVFDAATKAEVAGSPFAAGAFPSGICVDSIGQVWIANTTVNTVTIYNAATLTEVVGSPKPTGLAPYGVADDGLGRVWITNQTDATASIYVSATLVLDAGSPVATGVNPRGLSNDGVGKMWIANKTSGDVTVYDIATLALDAGSPVLAGGEPEDVSVDASGRAWVTDYLNGIAKTYDVATLAYIATYPLGTQAGYSAVDSLGQVWVTCVSGDFVAVYIS